MKQGTKWPTNLAVLTPPYEVGLSSAATHLVGFLAEGCQSDLPGNTYIYKEREKKKEIVNWKVGSSFDFLQICSRRPVWHVSPGMRCTEP